MKKAKPPFVFKPPGPPPRTGLRVLVLLLEMLVILGSIGVVVYWIRTAAPMKPLVCDRPSGMVSLTRWGSCKTE